MRKIFIVNREMCGEAGLSEDFDLEDFCERLQGKISDVEIVPAEAASGVSNASGRLIGPQLIHQALGEYYPR